MENREDDYIKYFDKKMIAAYKRIKEKLDTNSEKIKLDILYKECLKEIEKFNKFELHSREYNLLKKFISSKESLLSVILHNDFYELWFFEYYVEIVEGFLAEMKRVEYLEYIGKNNAIIVGGNGAGKSALTSFFKRADSKNIVVIPAQKLLYYKSDLSVIKATKFEIEKFQDENYNEKSFYDEHDLFERIRKLSEMFSYYIAVVVNDFIMTSLEKGLLEEKHISRYDNLCIIWKKFFPDITLEIDIMNRVLVPKRNGVKYDLNYLSEGEKVILLYIMIVLYAKKDSYIIIDEPETFLNPSMYNRLWNLLETWRSDCIFIYISHNMDFISSRSLHDLYWCRNYDGKHTWEIKKIQSNLDELPKSLILELLGSSKKILFCEGDKNSLDYKIYTALFENEVVVIPVGGHRNVINYTRAYNKSNFFGYSAFGIIDKDYHTEEVLKKYKKENIYHLKFNEIEMFLLTEEIIDNVLNANHSKEDAKNLKENFKKDFMTDVEKRRENIINRYVKYQIDQCIGVLDDYKFNGDYSTEKIKLYYNNIIDDLNLEDLINKLNEELNNLFVKREYNKFLEISNFKYLFEHNSGKIFGLDYKHISCNKIDMDSELRKKLREKYFLELTNKLLEKNN